MLVVLVLLIVTQAFLHSIVIALSHSIDHVSFVFDLAFQGLTFLFFRLNL